MSRERGYERNGLLVYLHKIWGLKFIYIQYLLLHHKSIPLQKFICYSFLTKGFPPGAAVWGPGVEAKTP